MDSNSIKKVAEAKLKATKPRSKATKPKPEAEVIPEVANQQNLPISTSDLITSFEVITSTSPTSPDVLLPMLHEIDDRHAESAIHLLQSPPPDVPSPTYEEIDRLSVDQLLDRADGCIGAIRMLARRSAEQLWLAGQAWSAAKDQVDHGAWTPLITGRGYSDSSVRQTIRVFKHFPDVNSIKGLTITQAKIESGVAKSRPARPTNPTNWPVQEPHEMAEFPQATSAPSGTSGPKDVRVVIEEHDDDEGLRGLDFQTRVIDTPSMAFELEPSARPKSRFSTSDTASRERAKAPNQATTPQGDVIMNPPEEEVPVDWTVPSEPFQPPGQPVELPPPLATSVEWLRQAALFFAWLVAENGLLPPLQHRDALTTFNSVVNSWKFSRPSHTVYQD